MAGSIHEKGFTNFNPEVSLALAEINKIATTQKVAILDSFANEIIDRGGFCDKDSFDTVFFGDTKIPDELKVAHILGERAVYSQLEPFIDMDCWSFNPIDHLGLVMPGAKEFGSTAVGYKISKKTGGSRALDALAGRIVFKRCSKSEDYEPYDDHVLFDVVRPCGVFDAKYSVYKNIDFGVIAAREYILNNEPSPSPDEIKSLDGHINLLREEARKFIDPVRP